VIGAVLILDHSLVHGVVVLVQPTTITTPNAVDNNKISATEFPTTKFSTKDLLMSQFKAMDLFHKECTNSNRPSYPTTTRIFVPLPMLPLAKSVAE
jgi:hypothetical protein